MTKPRKKEGDQKRQKCRPMNSAWQVKVPQKKSCGSSFMCQVAHGLGLGWARLLYYVRTRYRYKVEYSSTWRPVLHLAQSPLSTPRFSFISLIPHLRSFLLSSYFSRMNPFSQRWRSASRCCLTLPVPRTPRTKIRHPDISAKRPMNGKIQAKLTRWRQ